MRTWLFGVVVAIGCGGGTSAKDLCKKIDKLCAADFTDKDIEECSEDIPKLKGPLGDNYDKLLGCADSKTCAELAGCASGALANAGAEALEDFERGFGRTFKDKDEDKRPRRDDDDTSERSRRTERTERTERSERTERRSRRTGGPLRRGEPLPPQCKRFDEVCSEDRHVIERSECLDRVDDLKADHKRMAELVACYEKVTTCAGFDKCSTDMWFEIQRDR